MSQDVPPHNFAPCTVCSFLVDVFIKSDETMDVFQSDDLDFLHVRLPKSCYSYVSEVAAQLHRKMCPTQRLAHFWSHSLFPIDAECRKSWNILSLRKQEHEVDLKF